MRSTTIAVILFAVSVCSASAQDAAAGHYYLRGVREVGSELLLRPNGTFDYMFAYGASDYMASGTWRRDGDSVVLNSTGKDEPPFKLLRSAKATADGIRVIVKGPNGQPVPNIDTILLTASGKVNGRTDSSGAAEFPAVNRPKAVMFEIPVYNFQSKPTEVNAAHNEFQFEINGEAIATVQFKSERLKMNGKALELRYWDPDKVMNYEKE